MEQKISATDKNQFNEVIAMLKKMRLSALAAAYTAQLNDLEKVKDMSFSDRFYQLIQAEYDSERNHKIERLIKDARIPIGYARFSEIKYSSERRLDREVLEVLATNEYIKQALNVIVMGSTGCGKSFIGSCLAFNACEAGIKTKFIRFPTLLGEFDTARSLGNYAKVLEKYQKVPLLVIDDFLLTPTTNLEQRDLLELMEGRCGLVPTVFCTQTHPSGWHSKLDNSILADSILDRILPTAYKLAIQGDSMRRKLSLINHDEDELPY